MVLSIFASTKHIDIKTCISGDKSWKEDWWRWFFNSVIEEINLNKFTEIKIIKKGKKLNEYKNGLPPQNVWSNNSKAIKYDINLKKVFFCFIELNNEMK